MIILKYILEILNFLSILDNKSINCLLDNCINIEYCLESNNLILSFNKEFFKTFKQNITLFLDLNDIKEYYIPFYTTHGKIEIKYKIESLTFYDRNFIKISIPLYLRKNKIKNNNFKIKKLNFIPLIMISDYIYNNRNFKGLSYYDKKQLPYNFRLKNKTNKKPMFYSTIYEKVNNSYYDNKGNSLINCYIDIPINEYQYKNEYKNLGFYIYNEYHYKLIIAYFFKIFYERHTLKLFLNKNSLKVYNKNKNILLFEMNKTTNIYGIPIIEIIDYYHKSKNINQFLNKYRLIIDINVKKELIELNNFLINFKKP